MAKKKPAAEAEVKDGKVETPKPAPVLPVPHEAIAAVVAFMASACGVKPVRFVHKDGEKVAVPNDAAEKAVHKALRQCAHGLGYDGNVLEPVNSEDTL